MKTTFKRIAPEVDANSIPLSKQQRLAGFLFVLGLAGCLSSVGCVGLTSAKSKSETPSPSTSILIEPSAISFGSIELGTSKTQNVKVTNIGNTNLVIAQITATGVGFSLNSLNASLTLMPGQSSSFGAVFAPKSAGIATGRISLRSTTSDSLAEVALTGVGRADTSQLSVSATSLSFGNVPVATSSGPVEMMLTNTGNRDITVSQINATSDRFQVRGLSLPLILGLGQNASFSAVFVPAVAGDVAGSLSIVSSATGSPATINLSGTGVQPQIYAIPPGIEFGEVPVGRTNSQTLTLGNSGNADLIVTQATSSGGGFTLGPVGLPIRVAPGQSTQLTVSFAPSSVGVARGSLSVFSNAQPARLTVGISGTGAIPRLQISANPTAVNFGEIAVGSSGTQLVSLKNIGNSDVTIARITVIGNPFSANGLALPVILSAGQTANFNAIFAPITTGGQAGTVTVISTASNSPLNIASSGLGVQAIAHSVTLSWTPSTSVVAGYYVYRGTATGGPYDKLNAIPVDATAYSDTAVQSGATYFYVVTAVDGSAVESEFSTEVSTGIPTP